VRRLVALAAVACALLPACASTDRPEGVVERWLISLNQGSAGRPDRYADPDVSERILPGWDACEPGALDTIRVGRQMTRAGTEHVGDGSVAVVPYEVEYADDAAELCDHPVGGRRAPAGYVVAVRPRGGDWRVTDLQRIGPGEFRFPAFVARPVAAASPLVWLAGAGLGLLLCAFVALLMRATPRPRPVPSEPIDPTDARGL